LNSKKGVFIPKKDLPGNGLLPGRNQFPTLKTPAHNIRENEIHLQEKDIRKREGVLSDKKSRPFKRKWNLCPYAVEEPLRSPWPK